MRNMLKKLGIIFAALMLAVMASFGGTALAQEAAEPPKPGGTVADLKLTDKEYAQGPADAKVVIVEYASLTCPHCAQFHTTVLPGIKKEFVDTGKVRYVYRDFPLDRLALGAAMVARCAGRDNFFGFIDTFYAAQGQWSRASNPVSALGSLARLGGMSQSKFEACLKDVEIQNEILRQRLEAANDFKVQSTPTVFVNGERYGGGMTLPQFRTLLNRKLAK
jgi:protein-disulfide isomerase